MPAGPRTAAPSVTKQSPNGSPAKAPAGSLLAQARPVAELPVPPIHMILYGKNRIGKCLGLGTPVMMFDGTVKAVEDVETGDLLMGPDSRPRTVLSTNTGTGQLYRIVPNKGDSWVCNDEHILTLTGCNGVPSVEGVVKDISVNQYLADIDNRVPRADMWCLFRQPVEFDRADPLPIDPYLVGLWMGDGSRGTASITNRRPVVQEYCVGAAKAAGMVCTIREEPRPGKNTARISFVTKTGTGGVAPGANKFLSFFRNECAAGDVKKIPHAYLTASRSDRLALLAGILDTDGEDTKTPSTVVVVTGEPYRDGLLFLCRSLGFSAYSTKSRVHVCTNGKVSTYFTVVISGDLDRVPTKVKIYQERRRKNRVTVTRFEVEDEGVGDYYGFTLDGDGRFLLGDFTVTHNTTLACEFPKPLLLVSCEEADDGGAGSVRRTAGVNHLRLDTVDKVEQLARELYAAPDFGGYKTVVLDSGTSLEELMLKKIKGWEKTAVMLKVGNKSPVTTDDYIKRSEDMRTLLRPFLELPVNVIVLANEKDHNPQESRKPSMVRGPHTESFFAAKMGAGTTSWLQDCCNFICQLYMDKEVTRETTEAMGVKTEVLTETGRYVRRLRTAYHPNFAAGGRFSRPELVPDYIESPDGSPKGMYDRLMELARDVL